MIILHEFNSGNAIIVNGEQIKCAKQTMRGSFVMRHDNRFCYFRESVQEIQDKLREERKEEHDMKTQDYTLKISLDDGAIKPERAHAEDAGLDLFTPSDVLIPARGSAIINIGVHVQIPTGYAGIIEPKSGLNVKHGIIAHGVIDAGYTGAIVVKLYNLSDTDYQMHRGDKVTQMIIHRVYAPDIQIVDAITGGSRGDGGFGSTGK